MTDNALAVAQSALDQIACVRMTLSELSAGLASLSAQVRAQGGTVIPKGQAVTGLTSTIKSEASARADADNALATRIGSLQCGLQGADATAKSALTTRITAAEKPTLEVDPGKAVEPLRLGKVTFYGESARVIRDAQAVLESAGAGQLEVIKREPFKVTADGQVFISEAVVGKAAIDPARFKVKLGMHQGRTIVAGIGVGVQPEKPKVIIAQELLDEIQQQIRESNLGKNLSSLEDRLAAIELGRVTQKGLDEATAARFCQRIDALQAQVDMLQGKAQS